ncbi:MAG: peptidylprolyl isomerase [Xylophilus ampelinus]
MAMLAMGAASAQQPTAAPRVKLSTSLGDIVLELDAAKAPRTVDNFLQYVRDRQYDNTVFHRVIDGFMIQGGGFGTDMREKPTRAPILLETSGGLKNLRGTVAMARTSNPNSATSQFFINVKDNPGLDAPRPDGYGYAVFGKVVDGMPVVDKIRAVATGSRGGHQDVPVTPVLIQSAMIVQP